MKWVQSGEYDRIVRGEYRRRGDQTDVREEAGDAVEFYAERFRKVFRETGDNLAKAGSQVGGVAEQVADWIRNRGGRRRWVRRPDGRPRRPRARPASLPRGAPSVSPTSSARRRAPRPPVASDTDSCRGI